MLQATEMNFEKLSGSSYCLNFDKFCERSFKCSAR